MSTLVHPSHTAHCLEPLPYTLDLECPVPWPTSQEAAILSDYPFSTTQEESVEDFVIRRYLETLWLPESLMSLSHLILSLRRVGSSPSTPHPLHEALKPLLLTVRATHEKYHSELPQILHDGRGAGELEETVMWYAWSKEKFEPSATGSKEEKDMEEEEWKSQWMERLERREVQIQILLYLQLLAIPPVPPTTPQSSSNHSGRHKRKSVGGPPTPAKSLFPLTSSMETTVALAPPTPAKSTTPLSSSVNDLNPEDQLEYFMDKLSLWQLMASLRQLGPSQTLHSETTRPEKRDWMQGFCEDVVEPLFKDRLPEQCALLRTKVFPHSPFSENSDAPPSPPSPNLHAADKTKTKRKRPPSPLHLTEVQKRRADSSQPSVRRAEPQEPGSAPDRSRSRSRSVSMSVEEVRARGASRGGVASNKSLFKGEVEMKRTASKTLRPGKLRPTAESQQGSSFTRREPPIFYGSVGVKPLIENVLDSSAPILFPSTKHSASRCRSPGTGDQIKLAIDTPVKKLVKIEEDGHDIVESPDALLLTSETFRGDGEDALRSGYGNFQTFVVDTPIKNRSKR